MTLGRQNSLIREIAVLTPLIKISLLVSLVILLSSCASNSKKDALKNADYTSDRNGISLKLAAPARLNLVSNLPHTLALAVVQLNSSKAALALSKSSPDLDKLLSGIPPTDNAVLAVDRYVIQPSAADTLTIGRVKDAQVIVIYAGYFNALLDKRVRMYEIPVKISSTGWFKQTYSGSPLPLNLSMNLGETSIVDLSIIKSNTDDDETESPNKDNPTLNGAQPPSNSQPSKVMGL
jgi:hypothetical protein